MTWNDSSILLARCRNSDDSPNAALAVPFTGARRPLDVRRPIRIGSIIPEAWKRNHLKLVAIAKVWACNGRSN
jgi:hypothetical protein